MPARGEEDAPLLPQSGCEPRHCANSGSGGCPCRARAAGARLAAPGWSLPGKCRKRALNSSTYFSPASSSSLLPARDLGAAACAACVWGPPASYSHARTHSLVRSLASTPTRCPPRRSRATETTRPTAAGTAGAARWPGVTRRRPPRPGLPPAPPSPPPPPGTMVSRVRCLPRAGEGLEHSGFKPRIFGGK